PVARDDEPRTRRLAGDDEVHEPAVVRDHAAVEDDEMAGILGSRRDRSILWDVHDLDEAFRPSPPELDRPSEVRQDDEVRPVDHPPLPFREDLSEPRSPVP